MPIYQYSCEFGHLHEEYQSIKDFDKNRVVECPQCGNTMESYIDAPPLGFVHNDPTTIGQLGEANFKKLGKIKGDEMMAKKREDEAAARKASGVLNKEQVSKARKLANMNDDQKRRYIMTGKLPPGK